MVCMCGGTKAGGALTLDTLLCLQKYPVIYATSSKIKSEQTELQLVSKELQVTLMEESCFQLILLISTPNFSHDCLNVCVSQSSHVEILLHKVIVLG